jgi:hypothetical protein
VDDQELEIVRERDIEHEFLGASGEVPLFKLEWFLGTEAVAVVAEEGHATENAPGSILHVGLEMVTVRMWREAVTAMDLDEATDIGMLTAEEGIDGRAHFTNDPAGRVEVAVETEQVVVQRTV